MATIAFADGLLGATSMNGPTLISPFCPAVKFASRLAGTVTVPKLFATMHSMAPTGVVPDAALSATDTLPSVPGVQETVKAADAETLIGLVSESAGVRPVNAAGSTTEPLNASTVAPVADTPIESPGAHMNEVSCAELSGVYPEPREAGVEKLSVPIVAALSVNVIVPALT